MKMKTFRYSTQIALRETINGLLWCIAAILWVFDNPACRMICVVLLAIAVFSQAFSIFGKFEKSDEMATANMREAKVVSLDISRIILLAVSVVLLIIPKEVFSSINWRNIIYPAVVFMVGLPEVITGLMFKRIEEE